MHTVSARLRVTDGVKSLQWEWRSEPSSPEEINELFSLLSDIYDYVWKGGNDDWIWKADANGEFSVNKARSLMFNCHRQITDIHMKWKGWVPLKCKIMVWRAMLNRMPTKVELCKRGVTLPSDLCNLCDLELETTNHLFTGCVFAAEIWSWVESWCHLPPIFAFDVSDFLKIANLQATSKHSRYILRGIVFTTLWAIWNERNDRIFKGKRRRAIEVVESIKMTSFFLVSE